MDDFLHTAWSEEIQGVLTLYLSRRLRFDDCFSAQYTKLFALDRGRALKILEIGCGPGALAGALRRWYPCAELCAVDRDSNFIRFARAHEPGIRFMEADATRLPFPDESFDATISYTVSEHIEPSAFFGEQRRVLSPGGICLCLAARRGVQIVAPCLRETEAERAFWETVRDDAFERLGVGKYRMNEAELPAAMERYGFQELTTGYAVADLTPDDPQYSAKQAEAMIEAARQSALEAIASAHSDRAGPAIAAVNAKYDERLRFLRRGIKQWDTETSVTQIVRGVRA